jgi:ActR/RegA family two-component response regulator
MNPHVNAPWNPQDRLLLAHGDNSYRSEVTRKLRARGVDVTATSTAGVAHGLAQQLAPAVMVLDTNLQDESGPLVCAKMKISYPDCKVILVGPELTGEAVRLAAFVGADAFVARSEGLEALVRQILRSAVSTAC